MTNRCCVITEVKKHVFTPLEKKYFVDIIQKFRDIIESKETDGATLKIKNAAWNKIAEEFNSSPHACSQATSKQLRRLWLNLKHRQREARAKNVKYEYQNYQNDSELMLSTDSLVSADPLIVMDPLLSTSPPQILRTDYKCETQTEMEQNNTNYAIEYKTYKDEQRRSTERHELEMQILREQLREAKAKAELAVLILRQTKEKEELRKQKMAAEKHEIQMHILREQHREAQAKADLGELALQQWKDSIDESQENAT